MLCSNNNYCAFSISSWYLLSRAREGTLPAFHKMQVVSLPLHGILIAIMVIQLLRFFIILYCIPCKGRDTTCTLQIRDNNSNNYCAYLFLRNNYCAYLFLRNHDGEINIFTVACTLYFVPSTLYSKPCTLYLSTPYHVLNTSSGYKIKVSIFWGSIWYPLLKKKKWFAQPKLKKKN